MSELHRIQQDMLAWLMKKDDAIKPDIIDTGEVSKVSVEQRLDIYGKAYGYRLIDALSDNYPAVHTLMGDDDFYEMSYAYIAAHPSKHFSLRYFGHKLESFLAAYEKGLPVYTEMARFEWALRNAFDSDNTPALTIASLQEIPIEQWGDITFTFHPSVSRVDLEWNIPQLWSAIDEGADPIAPEQLEHPIAWILWRKELLNYYRSLDIDEAFSLNAALQGNNFSSLCEGVCEWIDEEHAPARVAGFLSQWITDEILIDLQV